LRRPARNSRAIRRHNSIGPKLRKHPAIAARKPFDEYVAGLLSEKSRGDWRSFEPLIKDYVDAVMAANADNVAVTRLLKLSA
jgi:hypothetical protein